MQSFFKGFISGFTVVGMAKSIITLSVNGVLYMTAFAVTFIVAFIIMYHTWRSKP